MIYFQGMRRVRLALINVYSHLRDKVLSKIFYSSRSGLRITGGYSTFQEANSLCDGYGASAILDIVFKGVIDVLEGRGQYERDGVVFMQRPKKSKVREFLITLQEGSKVIDFGGGLGGTYINNRDIIPQRVEFIVVEQAGFSNIGSRIAADYSLPIVFTQDIDALPYNADMMILSSVLPYLEEPYILLDRLLRLRPQRLVIDRTALKGQKYLDYDWYLQDCSVSNSFPCSVPIQPILMKSLLAKTEEHGYELLERWYNDFDARDPEHVGLLFRLRPVLTEK